MLDSKFKRGFSQERLSTSPEPRARHDERGFYIMSLSENTKVYFDDFYGFLEQAYARAKNERLALDQKLADCNPEAVETLSFYRAKGVIVDVLMKTIVRFYTDGANLGVVMSPWCFGTVLLEKMEVYRDRIGKGEVNDPNVPEYPYYVVRYLDEIYKTVLLEMFDFPQQAFQMRWQYSELLKKYSKILTNITGQLNSVLGMIKNYGS